MKEYNFIGAQDWVKYFKIIFENSKIENLLEFGLGDGTEFLLDNVSNVTSLEISVSQLNKDWFDKSVNKYKNYKWNCVYIEADESIKKANEIAQATRYPIKYKDHIVELKKIVDQYTTENKYDLIFVDPGFHNRGDLVNLLFNKTNIIAAHDTSRDENRILKNIYGYNIVKIPKNYTEYHFEDTYMGTTLWIEKNSNPKLHSIFKEYNGKI
jgi:hypothetical protein